MRKIVSVKAPAKINLTLDVVNRRPDGFHEINSVMQLINLYDYITIKIEHAHCNQIILSGNSTKIPYDKNNLVYKAVELYCKETGLKDLKIDIYIEKTLFFSINSPLPAFLREARYIEARLKKGSPPRSCAANADMPKDFKFKIL